MVAIPTYDVILHYFKNDVMWKDAQFILLSLMYSWLYVLVTMSRYSSPDYSPHHLQHVYVFIYRVCPPRLNGCLLVHMFTSAHSAYLVHLCLVCALVDGCMLRVYMYLCWVWLYTDLSSWCVCCAHAHCTYLTCYEHGTTNCSRLLITLVKVILFH